jgi:hypothetical protein
MKSYTQSFSIWKKCVPLLARTEYHGIRYRFGRGKAHRDRTAVSGGRRSRFDRVLPEEPRVDLDFCYESFYASVSRDGFAIHLKCAPKTVADRTHRQQHEHLDAYIGVVGAAALHDELRSRGARITRPLGARPWSCRDFYVEDADGYILCFSEPLA